MYLKVKNLKKSYGEEGSFIEVLKGIDLSVEKGDMCVIQGSSGSGKSTLLHCIGGLDEIDSGSVLVGGTELGGLSGGQQQRCAIARALVKNPKLLLCDEPTGALDSETSRDILVLLEEVNRKFGTTMLIVTHNNSIKYMVDQVVYLKDGRIKRDYRNEEKVPAARLEDL